MAQFYNNKMGIRSIKPLYPFAYTGAPNRNRTSDTQFRKLLLYPTEL